MLTPRLRDIVGSRHVPIHVHPWLRHWQQLITMHDACPAVSVDIDCLIARRRKGQRHFSSEIRLCIFFTFRQKVRQLIDRFTTVLKRMP